MILPPRPILEQVADFIHGIIGEYPKREPVRRFFNIDKRAFDLLLSQIAARHWPNALRRIKRNGFSEKSNPGIASTVLFYPVLTDIIKTIDESIEYLDDLVDKYLEMRAVWFVGAGVSFEAEIGWQTVKAALRRCLAYKISSKDFEKEWKTDGKGGRLWKELRAMPEAMAKFKQAIASYIKSVKQKGKISKAHRLLANLWKKGKIEHLICFNWDDFIEYSIKSTIPIAYGSITGSIGKIHFWKPCGCVTHVDKPWLFPDQDIKLPPQLIDALAANIPRIGITVGFGGSVNFDKKYLKHLMGEGTYIYDIRPVLKPSVDLGDVSIKVGATFALDFIAKKILK